MSDLRNTAPVVTIICHGQPMCGWIEPIIWEDGYEGIILHYLDKTIGPAEDNWIGWSSQHYFPPRPIAPHTFVMDLIDPDFVPTPPTAKAFHTRRYN